MYKEPFAKSLKEKNSSYKIVDYDAAKIIYEDSHGDRHRLKKLFR